MRNVRAVLVILCGALMLAGCQARQERPSVPEEPIIPYLA
jgi:uncharacterized lipoprotein YajG